MGLLSFLSGKKEIKVNTSVYIPSIEESPPFEYQKAIYDPDLLCKCPYCGKEHHRIFRRQRKCEQCGKIVYVKHNILGETDNKKRLYTEQQINQRELDQEAKQCDLFLEGIREEIRLDPEFSKFTQIHGNDDIEIIFFQYKIQQAKSSRDLDMLSKYYKYLGHLFHYKGEDDKTYTCMMVDFLLYAMTGHLFFGGNGVGGKRDADEILHKFSEEKQKCLIDNVKDIVKKLINDMDLPLEFLVVFDFIGMTGDELQEYQYNKGGAEQLNKLNEIFFKYCENRKYNNF